MSLDLHGIVLASTITGATMFAVTLAYTRFGHQETKESFIMSHGSSLWENWPQYLKLGVPGVLIMSFDNWGYQAMLLLAAYFGTAAQQNMAVL